jgi:menaquinone-dependent protoporphyrinogen IX oxidase
VKGIVIYHSRSGNCKQVAESILAGLKESGADVTLAEVGSLEGLPEDLDFLVMGSPTRVGHASGPIRKFLKKVAWPAGLKFAAFGTALAKWLPKGDAMAAEDISESLKELGLAEIVPPLRAGVAGWKGPLAEGELDKAREFGKTVAVGLGQ